MEMYGVNITTVQLSTFSVAIPGVALKQTSENHWSWTFYKTDTLSITQPTSS